VAAYWVSRSNYFEPVQPEFVVLQVLLSKKYVRDIFIWALFYDLAT
jgi:hypothetical protein